MKNADMPAMPLLGRNGLPLCESVMSKSIGFNEAIGLTKREHFAGLAMQGLLANGNDGGLSVSHSAMYAIEYADALLAVLEE